MSKNIITEDDKESIKALIMKAREGGKAIQIQLLTLKNS